MRKLSQKKKIIPEAFKRLASKALTSCAFDSKLCFDKVQVRDVIKTVFLSSIVPLQFFSVSSR